MSSEVYTASGSLTAFKDNGATIDHYEWILPDGSIVTGDNISYTPSEPVGTITQLQCRAVDTLGNMSNYSTKNILIVDNTYPIIDSITWDDDVHEEQQTYTMTITAHDPDGTIESYDVTCDDPNVTIVQDSVNHNVFSVTYPDYNSDIQITYTITVTDNESNISTTDLVKQVSHVPVYPVIDDFTFQGSYIHDNSSNEYDVVAHDPDGTIESYAVACDDPNVTIVQNTTTPNRFTITMPDYTGDVQRTFTVTVTDNAGNSTTETFIYDVYDDDIISPDFNIS